MKKVLPIVTALFCSALTLFLSAPLKAQTAADYGFSIHSGTFTALTGGTVLSVLQVDDGATTVTLPFGFEFCGNTYNSVSVNSNGILRFGAATTSYSNDLNNISTIWPACMVLWDDLQGGSSTPTWHVIGTAPNRVFVMQWLNQGFPLGYTTNFTMQCFLYETTNVIEYVYGPGTTGVSNTGSATVGIVDQNGKYQTLNNLTANAVASSTSFATNIMNTSSVSYGTIFRWTPPEPCTTSPLSLITINTDTVICNGDPAILNIDLSALPKAPYVVTYQYQAASSSSGPWNNIGTVTPNRKYIDFSITGPTYYRAEIFCNGNSAGYTNELPVSLRTPPTPVGNDVTRCGYGTVTLNASGPDLYWFDGPTSSNHLARGTTYTTPMLDDTTEYYVANAFNRNTFSQQVISYSSTTNSYAYGPYAGYYPGGVFQYLISAAELTAAGYLPGKITAISFDVLQASNVAFGKLTISMKLTNATSVGAPDYNNLTKVYEHPNYKAVLGENKHEFTQPFFWDGTSAILVSVCRDNGTTYTNAYDYVNLGYYYINGMTNVLYHYSITSGNPCNTTSGFGSTYYRPFMKLEMVTGCESPRLKVKANVRPAPAFIASAHRQNICYGDSTYLLAYSINNPNYQYKWDGSNIVGNTYTVFPYLDTNRYSVKAFDSVLGSPSYGCEAYDTIEVYINDNPEVYLTPNSLPTTCPNVVQPLSANSSTGIQYQWFFNGAPIFGATAPFYGAMYPGSYTVLVTDANGCDSMSQPVVKTISQMPSVTIGYKSDLEFCQGSSVILRSPATGGDLSYQWYKDGNKISGAIDSFLEVTASGRYTLSIDDTTNHCAMTGDTLVVRVFGLPNPTINRVGMQLSTGNFASYAWLRNNQYIPGEIYQTYNVTSPGVYTVEVVDSNGCTNRAPLMNLTTGVDEVSTVSVNIYPNPTSGLINIDASADVNIEIYTLTGQLVYQKESVSNLKIDNLASGVYMVHIYDAQTQMKLKTEKVTKY